MRDVLIFCQRQFFHPLCANLKAHFHKERDLKLWYTCKHATPKTKERSKFGEMPNDNIVDSITADVNSCLKKLE